MSEREGGLRPGWRAVPGGIEPIDTARGYQARGDTLTLYCSNRHCHMCREAVGVAVDFGELIARGLGDVPFEAFRPRWKCRVCGKGPPQTIHGNASAPKGGGYPVWGERKRGK